MSHFPVLSPETFSLLQRIAEEGPDPVAVYLAPDWHVVYANRSYRRLAGDERSQVIGCKLADLFPGTVAAGAPARLERARALGQTISTRNVKVEMGPDASATWWDADHHPLPDTGGDFGAVLVFLRDRTAEVLARQQAEVASAALARQAEQMRLAIGAGRVYFWDLDLVTGKVEWSEGLAEACGLAPGAFAGTFEAFKALVHPDDLCRVEAAVAATIAGEAAFDLEFRMKRADGSERWLLSRGTVLRDDAGRAVRMIGIDLDLTERKRTEARFAESEARLRAAQDVAGFGMWEWNVREGHRWSPEMFLLHGLSPEQDAPDLGRWLAMINEDDRATLCEAERNGSRNPDRCYRALFRIHRADNGAECWLAVLGRVLEAATDGTPTRLSGINVDVTRLVDDLIADRCGAKTMGNGECCLRSLLEANAECAEVIEPGGKLSFMNASGMCRLAIEDLAPLRGREWATLWPEEKQARVRQAVTAAMSGQADRFESYRPSADGAPRWWDVAIAPVRDAAGRVVCAVANSRDITEFKRTEIRLRDEITAREKVVREVDRRIRSSLKTVAGLLRLQQGRTPEPAIVVAMDKAITRIVATAEGYRDLCSRSDSPAADLTDIHADLIAHEGLPAPVAPGVIAAAASLGPVPRPAMDALRAEAALAATRLSTLTEREREVFDLLVEGRLGKEVARELGLSPRTVEVHRANIMRRLGTRSLPEMVRLAMLVTIGGEAE